MSLRHRFLTEPILNVLMTSVLCKTDVESVITTLVFKKTDVISELCTSVLSQPMLFFVKKKLIYCLFFIM